MDDEPVRELEEQIKNLAQLRYAPQTMILCFFTDEMPLFCEPMFRTPVPPIGQLFDEAFGQHLREAISSNPALHDGAMMFGRLDKDAPYRLAGWSYRLYAPTLSHKPNFENKGSAFNSCHAMSAVERLDSLYLISGEQIWRFQNGEATTVQAESIAEHRRVRT